MPEQKRKEGSCPVFQKCGGCCYLDKSYEKQLKLKQQQVAALLKPYGKLEGIVGMEDPFYYRHKVHAVFGRDRKGKVIKGVYKEGTHILVPVEKCLLENEKAGEIITTIQKLLPSFKIKTYDEDTGYGLLRHVLVRVGHATGQIMVVLVLGSPILPSKNNFVKALRKEHPEITTVIVNVNDKKTSMVLGEKEQVIYGPGYIEDKLCGLTFKISPKSFYQVNPVQTEKLYSLALSYAGLTGRESVWDLYCGIGTISLFMALRSGSVNGVEIIPQAIADARENAKRNQINNVSFFTGRAEEVLPAAYEKEESHPDVIVVDPPRKGCDEKCLQTMLKMAPARIVYVSCDPATLARDLRILCEGGYELKRVRPVDQFAHTVHVETVVLLSQLRQKPDDYIHVDVDVAELEGTSAETKATYEKIKKYVAEHNDGMKVSNLYIAQVKRKCGLELAENFNLPKSEDSRQPRCPKEKEEAIMEALKEFQMI